MSVTWAQYRRARRRSRQAWIVLAAAALAVLLTLVWFFADGQFRLGGGFSDGPIGRPGAGGVDESRRFRAGGAGGPGRGPARIAAGQGRDPAANYDRAGVRTGVARRRPERLRHPQRHPPAGPRRRPVHGRVPLPDRVRQFREPYTGRQTAFRRGADSSKAIQIDHVVALGDAWQTGAQQLTALQRTHLANDPLNLVAADGPANQDKSSSDAAGWLPPNKAFRCHYVARQVSVKAAYALWVTAAEKDAMRRVLGSCPDQATIRPNQQWGQPSNSGQA